jgi:hypothetical protein
VTRSIPWPRILAEGVAIVVSILLAFGIQAWWDERGESVWEAAQLQVLRSEFEANLDHSEQVEGNHSTSADRLAQIRDWADSGQEGSTQPFPANVANHLIAWRTAEFSLGALEALISSGDLGRLESSELRRQLLRWRTRLDDVTEKEVLAQTFVEEVITPSLLGQGFIGDTYDARPPYADPPARLREDIALVASPELVDLVSARIGHLRMAAIAHTILADETRQLLALLPDSDEAESGS